MRLLALKDIPSCVTAIKSGSEFIELNPERAKEWLETGYAKEPDKPNVRGWDGPDWAGLEVVILASGESLTVDQCMAVDEWQGPTRKVIVINTTFRRAPWADLLYACDGRWWKAKESGRTFFEEAAQTFAKDQMWTQEQSAAKELGIHYVKSEKLPGLSKKPDSVNQGANSGYQAMGLAYLTGAKRIILLGFDCRGGHWHGEHPSGLKAKSPFKAWIENFRLLAAELKAAGVSVVNCSPGSALDAFPKGKLEDVLCSQSAPSVSTRSTAETHSSTV